jgi:hypothetical protein
MQRLRAMLVLLTGGIILALVAYVGTYVVLSRHLARRNGNRWAFVQSPGGLKLLGAPVTDQADQERLLGRVFWPCIVVDQAATQRVYLPASGRTACVN